MSLPQIEPGAEKTILLVNSNLDLINSIGEAFKEFGYGIVIAQDGEAAVSLYDVYKDQIVAVVLDIILPKKDGLIVLKEIKSKNLHVPVVILTNLDDQKDKSTAMEMGAKGYILIDGKAPQQIADSIQALISS